MKAEEKRQREIDEKWERFAAVMALIMVGYFLGRLATWIAEH